MSIAERAIAEGLRLAEQLRSEHQATSIDISNEAALALDPECTSATS